MAEAGTKILGLHDRIAPALQKGNRKEALEIAIILGATAKDADEQAWSDYYARVCAGILLNDSQDVLLRFLTRGRELLIEMFEIKDPPPPPSVSSAPTDPNLN